MAVRSRRGRCGRSAAELWAVPLPQPDSGAGARHDVSTCTSARSVLVLRAGDGPRARSGVAELARVRGADPRSEAVLSLPAARTGRAEDPRGLTISSRPAPGSTGRSLVCVLIPAGAGPAPCRSRSGHSGGAKGALAERIQAILAEPALGHAQFGISVSLPRRPVHLWAQRRTTLHPASTTKMATTAAAFALLPGRDPDLDNQHCGRGPHRWSGCSAWRPVLLGAGDPTISARHYPYRAPGAAAVRTGRGRRILPQAMEP